MIVVAGEALIDLAPRGDRLLPLPGGSPYNVAVGLARLGREVAYLGGLSTDGFGARLRGGLEVEGVRLELAVSTSAPTTLAVVHLDAAARATYGFYLEGTSANAPELRTLPPIPDEAALHVSFGAVSAWTDPAGAALAALLRQEAGRRFTSLDPNVRPNVLPDPESYAADVRDLVAVVDLVKVSDEDLSALEPSTDPIELARGWAASGPSLVVVTRGRVGAVACMPDGSDVEVEGPAVDVVDTVGAGDAFTSGLLGWFDARGLLRPGGVRGLDAASIREALGQAVRSGALACTRAGSDPPRADELAASRGTDQAADR